MSLRLCVLGCVGLLVACGGDTSTNGDGGPDGSSNDGTTNQDVATNQDGSSNDGTSTDGTSNDATGSDGGTGTSIPCGTTSCPLPSQSCCVDPGPPAVFACGGGDAGACQQGTTSLQCASAADCSSNQVCCLDATNDPAVATCATTCTGVDHALLCDPTATDAKNKCGDAGACGNGNIDTWQLTTKYGTCGNLTGPF